MTGAALLQSSRRRRSFESRLGYEADGCGSSQPLSIGPVATQAGCSVPTVRYYEEIGLLPRADRHAGGQRAYDDEDVKRLTFVRRCRDFGFSIEQTRSLTGLVQDRERSCTEARDLAAAHLEAVRARLLELRALERSIAGFVASCERLCVGGPGPDCAILDDLARQPAACQPIA